MIHKSRYGALFLIFYGFFSAQARAETRTTTVMDASTSGRLVRLSLGLDTGLSAGDPVLFSANERKIAAGRVYRVEDGTIVVAVLQKYSEENVSVDSQYDLLFGEPFPEADNLPNYVVDRDQETPNPANETFLTRDEERMTPELDDDDYTPELNLRPKFPEPRTYSTHNLTWGVALNRNRNLPAVTAANEPATDVSKYTTYQGYVARYAYTFRSHYWMKARAPALLSVEAMFGIYSFDHEFPEVVGEGGTSIPARSGNIRVFTPGLNLRYLIELNKLFRVYPYVGYIYNLVTANNATDGQLQSINGGRIIGGGGAQLVISSSIDARVDVGSDGLLLGMVVKF